MGRSFLNQPGLPIGLRNNNPGNIRPGDNWQGMIGTNGGFVVFKDVTFGIRAMAIDLRTKIGNGYNTITKIITRWAPPSENDTAAYISNVEYSTGWDADRVLTADSATYKRLIRAIMNIELGANYSAMVTDADINEGIALMGGGGADVVGPVGFGVSVGLFLFAVYLFATMPKVKRS